MIKSRQCQRQHPRQRQWALLLVIIFCFLIANPSFSTSYARPQKPTFLSRFIITSGASRIQKLNATATAIATTATATTTATTTTTTLKEYDYEDPLPLYNFKKKNTSSSTVNNNNEPDIDPTEVRTLTKWLMAARGLQTDAPTYTSTSTTLPFILRDYLIASSRNQHRLKRERVASRIIIRLRNNPLTKFLTKFLPKWREKHNNRQQRNDNSTNASWTGWGLLEAVSTALNMPVFVCQNRALDIHAQSQKKAEAIDGLLTASSNLHVRGGESNGRKPSMIADSDVGMGMLDKFARTLTLMLGKVVAMQSLFTWLKARDMAVMQEVVLCLV